MKETMKALVFHEPGDLRVERTNVPEINENEALVKVIYAGVCGTDNRIYKGTKKIHGPVIIGHEFSGVIARVGRDVAGFSEGDRVTAYPTITCGRCYACRAGNRNICVNRKTIGYEMNGAFAEYVRIPAEAITNGNLLHVPDGIDDKAAAISEPITAAYHGIERAKIAEGDTVVIIGAGPIGLFHVLFAKLKKAKTIVSVEPNPEKRKLAGSLGATLALDPNSGDIKRSIMNATSDEGADSVILDVGIPSLVAESLAYLKKGGTYVLFAGCPEGARITIDPNVIHYRELNLTGSSAATPDIQNHVLELIAKGQFKADDFISEVVPLGDWKKAIEMKGQYIGIKVLIDPWAADNR